MTPPPSRYYHPTLCISLLLALSAIHSGAGATTTYVVKNTVPRSTGGKKFARSIGTARAKHVMSSAASFILHTFRQTDSQADERKDVDRVRLIIDDTEGTAYTSNDEIHISSRYIAAYRGNVTREVRGLLYHEMTHVWQWDGKGKTPGGLIEGMADYVRLKAGYAPSGWARAGDGEEWDQGYAVTARFLDYCEGLKKGFVAELNKKMRFVYEESVFEELLGKSVQELWGDYKDLYEH